MHNLKTWEGWCCVLAVIISLSWAVVEHMHGRYLQEKNTQLEAQISEAQHMIGWR